MKKFILVILICSVSLAQDQQPTRFTAATIAQHAQYWIQNLPQLTMDEMVLLGNFLYFSLLQTSYESVARSALLMTHMQVIAMNKQLATNEQEARSVALTTSDLLKNIKEELLPLRAYSSKSLQACLQAIEKSCHENLKKVIVSLQTYGHAMITQFVEQDSQQINTHIKNLHDNLEGNVQKLTYYKEALQAILDHKNPYVKQGDNESMLNLDLSLSISDSTFACFHEICASAASVKKMSIDMLNISGLMFQLFYQAFYQQLSGPTPIIFDQNGPLAQSDYTEYLPSLENEKIIVSKKHYV